MGLFNTGGFIGEFRHSLDDKGRLTMPSAWRPKGDAAENFFLALPSIEEGSEAFVSVLSPKRIFFTFSLYCSDKCVKLHVLLKEDSYIAIDLKTHWNPIITVSGLIWSRLTEIHTVQNTPGIRK